MERESATAVLEKISKMYTRFLKNIFAEQSSTKPDDVAVDCLCECERSYHMYI